MPLAILFGVLFTVAVSAALGALLLGNSSHDWGVRFVTGAALLSTSVFCLCSLGLAYAAAFAIFGCAALWAAWQFRRPVLDFGYGPIASAIDGKQRYVFLIVIPFFLLYLFNSMAPEISYDGSRYHLGLVSRYLREHGFHRITDNMYASLSEGMEMLYLFAFSFGKHSAAAMVHFAFILALAWMIFSYGRRSGFPLAGAWAALLVFATPVVGVDGTSAYNDVAVGAIAFGLFYLLQAWDRERLSRLLVAIGLLAGFGYATKYTAWVGVPYALGFVAWKSRRLRDVVTVALCAALIIAPWMLKNWLWVQNPLAPFYNSIFLNPHVGVAFEREYRQYLTTYDLKSRWEIPLQVTVHGALAGVLGPVFLMSPIALLALGRREGRQLLLAAAIFGSTYFTNIGTRFLISPLPFVAMAMMLVLSRVPPLAVAVVVVHAVLSWPSVVRRYTAVNDWHLFKFPYREALRIKPEEGYLASNLPYYRVTRMVEQSASPGSTVYSFTPIPEAYTSRKIRVAYESTENIIAQRIIFTGFIPEYAPVWRLRFAFPRQALRGIRIVQSNTGQDVWTMHELRLFDGTREWTRGPRWRLSARPDNWRIENLFDDNLMTAWLCGDTLHPGQFVQVDFGQTAAVDSVRIETSPNQWGIHLSLEGEDASGGWHMLAAKPEYLENAPTPPDLRRRAAAELKRSGIDYVLMFDGEFGADDFQKNAALWGVLQVAEQQGARLYQLP
ncbi:MAG TPA: glycosyltransferase family 39 protein [Bryobacteraceae bacterium]|nr:glycosyltransferase family 39 protein [Bryobacteraceae bacterium]